VELRVERKWFSDKSTIGELTADGVFQCFTLEDVVRADPTPDTPVTVADVAAVKVPGKTAIPPGRYRVIVTRSERFKRDLPLLQAVPGFEGIRIHAGNSDANTEGCILVGQERDEDLILRSVAALEPLIGRIREGLAAGPVWLTIREVRGSVV
jgi:Family of unknown function (DUF5675)